MSKDTERLQKLERRLYNRIPFIGGWLRRRAAIALARDGSPQAIKALAEAVASDSQVRATALEALRGVRSQAGIDAICAVWAEERHPDLDALLVARDWVASEPQELRVLTALKVGRREVTSQVDAYSVGPLVAACEDVDPEIARRARWTIDALDEPEVRQAVADQLCGRWAESRSPQLEQIMLQERYVAQRPLKVRVLSALRTAQPHLVGPLGAEGVPVLLRACEDPDATIAAGAHMLLRQLESREAREAVCRLVIEKGETHARAAALDANYFPRDPYQRALFFFLTGQWERYEALDFDQRMLRTLYASAAEDVRRRVREQLRAAGRTDFVTVVAGGDYRSRAAEMTTEEAEFLVNVLADQRAWDRLWRLAFELHFGWSVRILELLAGSGWRPPEAKEQEVFESLAALATAGIASVEKILPQIPPAALRARARVPGRINAVAFSPCRPVIAVGTGQRKVVLWNLQQAKREWVLDGFEHSVGEVTFAEEDVLWCGERTNSTRSPCSVYRWREGGLWRVGQHVGSVTALEPVDGSRVLSTGRDHRIVLWDGQNGADQRRFGSWARAASVAADGRQALLLHQGVTLIALPQLEWLAGGKDRRGVSRCATFAPGGQELIVGKYNGSVILYQRQGKFLYPRWRLLLRHEGRVQGVVMLADRSILVTAGSEGRVHFMDWTDHSAIGDLQVPGEQLTSLHLSPDGAFMAVGDSDASLSLWDLRVLDVPALLRQPFAQTGPVHLPAVTALADDDRLPLAVRDGMQFVRTVLRHRLRHDIEIEELPEIQAGEFDIELEG